MQGAGGDGCDPASTSQQVRSALTGLFPSVTLQGWAGLEPHCRAEAPPHPAPAPANTQLISCTDNRAMSRPLQKETVRSLEIENLVSSTPVPSEGVISQEVMVPAFQFSS